MTRRTITVLSMLVCVAIGLPAAVKAQEGTSTEPPYEYGERREVPNYDGRLELESTDAVDVVLWIPRVLFAPLYLVTEFVIRKPLGLLMTELERIDAFTEIVDFFTFGPERQIGIFPVALYEFGFSPSVGVYAFWNDFIIENNRISVRGATWGPDWLSLTVSERFWPTPQILLNARFWAVKRPDQIFRGIGWNATRAERSRYAIELIDASLRFGQRPWRRTTIDYEIGYRSASFENSRWDGDPGVLDAAPPPPAFFTGYNAVRFGAAVVVDSREIRELMTGGVRAGLFAQQNVGFGGIPRTRWITWGASLTLATDVLGNGRVLAITGETAFISAFDEDDPQAVVPFTELIDASGDGPLRGFWPGEIRGESVLALSLSYVWPIWVWLDAYVRATIGNAFGRYADDFEFERLRLSFDLGVRPRFEGESQFEILFGIGTHTFDAGTEIASIRFAVGTRSDILCLDRYCY